MLIRDEPGGLIAIGQPAHAWLSGQLARAWGNERFGAFAPWAEVCLGTEQHDIGMAAWDNAPTLNPRTGRPHTFMDMPTAVHLRLWSAAAPLVVPQSRYAALLVSLHGTGLYERRDLSADPPELVEAIRRFLDEQHRFQASLLASLRSDPDYAPHATPDAVARNRQLLRIWDALSLAICHGVRGERAFADVPAADVGAETLTLRPISADPARLTLSPWPFRHDTVTLVVEGRRLQPEPFVDETALRAAFHQAPWATIRTILSCA